MELEDLITSFKSANQLLRKRAIALGILMTLAIALRYSENVRYNNVFNLLEYQGSLEEIAKLSDSSFCAVIDGDWDVEKKYFSLNCNLPRFQTMIKYNYSVLLFPIYYFP